MISDEYSAKVEHPDRFELNSATAMVEHPRRSNWTIRPQRLYIDKISIAWYHEDAFSRNGG